MQQNDPHSHGIMRISNMHPILVTAASGRTGNAVVRQLLQAGHPVRAVVHRHDDRSDALKSLGADVTVADLFDGDGLRSAMESGRWIADPSATEGRMLASARPAHAVLLEADAA
jgi:nucleoside-diphosphate-sugar epimerase